MAAFSSEGSLTSENGVEESSQNNFGSSGVSEEVLVEEVNRLVLQSAELKSSFKAYVESNDSAVALKQGLLTFDSTPTEGSTNPVTSGGVYSAILESDKDYLPVGTMLRWPYGASLPTGYMKCDGNSFDKTKYAKLYSVLNSNVLPTEDGSIIKVE